MIHLPKNVYSKINFLVGKKKTISNRPYPFLDSLVVEFLSDLSKGLISHKNIKNYPDIVTFAFWCRKSNLNKIITENNKNQIRFGLGLLYHNSPSNVPINFAYSLVFGLLSGNSSVVRVSSKTSPSRSIVIDEISMVLKIKKYRKIKDLIHVIQFDHDDQINEFWISNSDGRLIWGGDNTVLKMRKYYSRPRSREIVFPDRYSICVLNAKKILGINKKEMDKLCEGLFNDIYLLNQMACSSPQLFNWIGLTSDIKKAKKKLWPLLIKYAKDRNNLKPVEYMNKYLELCKNVIVNKNIKEVNFENNLLYNIELKSFENLNKSHRGYYGTLNEISSNKLNEIASIIDERCQTLTYYGFKKDQLIELIAKNRLRGIDRIVPIGKSIDMDIVWDGYDILNQLSRNIIIR